MPNVIIPTDGTLDQSHPCVSRLQAAGFSVQLLTDPKIALGQADEQTTIDALDGADAVMAWAEHYTARTLAGLPKLRVIARVGVGFDKVDLTAATARNVAVTITPTANHEAVAEHAMALMLAWAKSLLPSNRAMRAGKWPKPPLAAVRQTTLGIVGLGRIGRSLALRAQAMRMKVIATELHPDAAFVQQHGIELQSLDDLLAKSDFVSLNCPLNDQTRGLIAAPQLARMKKGAVLVNTARGKLIVQRDLVAALQSGHLGGAALDVFEEQPTDADNPLFTLDNVVASPHVAGDDALASIDMGKEAAGCIIDLHAGRWPQGAVVNNELEGKWKW